MEPIANICRHSVIPYQEPSAKAESAELGSSLSSTLPMAAMFMRNKMVGWYVQLRTPPPSRECWMMRALTRRIHEDKHGRTMYPRGYPRGEVC